MPVRDPPDSPLAPQWYRLEGGATVSAIEKRLDERHVASKWFPLECRGGDGLGLTCLGLDGDEKRRQSLSQSQSQNSNPNPSRTPGEELSPIPTLWRVRGDLRAASVMRDRGLWLSRDS